MSRSLRSTQSIRRAGARIVALAVDNHASRLAYRMACAMLRAHDELQLVTVVADEEGRASGDALLSSLASDAPLAAGARVTRIVLTRGDALLADVIADHAADARAVLVVCGSHTLCVTGTRDDPLPAAGSFALRLAKVVRSCPLLVVKANNMGHYLQSGSAATGLRVLIDCQSNTRHLLAWLMGRLDPDKDGLFLAVTRAVDKTTGTVKDTAQRMMTNFSVQASVGEYYTAQRLLKDYGAAALAQAAKADAIDVIAVQAPPCRTLPDVLVDVLNEARCSVLIYHPPPDGPEGEGGSTSLAATAAADDLASP